MEHLYIVGGSVKWYSHLWRTACGRFLVKSMSAIFSINATPKYLPKEIGKKNLYKNYPDNLLHNNTNPGHPKCPSTGE